MKEVSHKIKTKICGIKRAEDIGYVNLAMPDYIGFVFARNSRRFITDSEATTLKLQLNPSIHSVGVFVNEDLEHIARLLDDGIIDMAQLHGKEDDDYIEELHKLSDKPLIKAYHISTEDELTRALESKAEYLLFDSSDAGSGRICDWSLLSHVQRPYFLAGGLNANNVVEALMRLNPYAIDVSTGVETDGHKDYNKIIKLVQVVVDWNKRK